jgi:hypothetical protein
MEFCIDNVGVELPRETKLRLPFETLVSVFMAEVQTMDNISSMCICLTNNRDLLPVQ